MRSPRSPTPFGLVTKLGTVALLLASCSKDSGVCLALPCPFPLAIAITVTSAVPSAALSGVNVRESAPDSTSVPCDTTCFVPGTAGTYQLDISAPGFTTAHLTVQVRGTNTPCGCSTVATEQVAVALVPAT